MREMLHLVNTIDQADYNYVTDASTSLAGKLMDKWMDQIQSINQMPRNKHRKVDMLTNIASNLYNSVVNTLDRNIIVRYGIREDLQLKYSYNKSDSDCNQHQEDIHPNANQQSAQLGTQVRPIQICLPCTSERLTGRVLDFEYLIQSHPLV